MEKPVIYHIPVCPFSQRVEILLALKGLSDALRFHVVDITEPRPPWLREKTGSNTALPVLETESGGILRESMVILRYVEERWGEPLIARLDPFERGIERLFATREGAFGTAGYKYVMSTERERSGALRDELLLHYRWLGEMLETHNPAGTWLFDRFGLPEIIYTPLMMRFWFLEYYEGFALPETPEYARVARWRAACLNHPAAQQVCYEEIVKLYYDYAVGVGNGALPKDRRRSSFVFEPGWRDRPMPPQDKYERVASDSELGLLPA